MTVLNDLFTLGGILPGVELSAGGRGRAFGLESFRSCNSAHSLLFGTSSNLRHNDPRPLCLLSLAQKESKISRLLKVLNLIEFYKSIQVDRISFY